MREVHYDERDADLAVRGIEIQNEAGKAWASYELRGSDHAALQGQIDRQQRLMAVATERSTMHQGEGAYREAYRFSLLSLQYLRSATIFRALQKGKEWSGRVNWQDALVKYEHDFVLDALATLRASLEQLQAPEVEIDWFPSTHNFRSIVKWGYQGVISTGDVEYGRYLYTPCLVCLTTNPRLATDLPIVLPPDRGPFHSLEAAKLWVANKFVYLEGLDA